MRLLEKRYMQWGVVILYFTVMVLSTVYTLAYCSDMLYTCTENEKLLKEDNSIVEIDAVAEEENCIRMVARNGEEIKKDSVSKVFIGKGMGTYYSQDSATLLVPLTGTVSLYIIKATNLMYVDMLAVMFLILLFRAKKKGFKVLGSKFLRVFTIVDFVRLVCLNGIIFLLMEV